MVFFLSPMNCVAKISNTCHGCSFALHAGFCSFKASPVLIIAVIHVPVFYYELKVVWHA